MSLEISPCKGCTERFPACSDKCPKDARGERGYKAWKAEYQAQQALIKEYKRCFREDWLRGDLRTEKQKKMINKNGKVVSINVRK